MVSGVLATVAAFANGYATPASPSCASLKAAELGSNVSVLSAESASAHDGWFGKKVEYCLVKVLVEPAINIWVGLPSDGSYNGRFMAVGGGGFAGSVSTADLSPMLPLGYACSATDTGHVGGALNGSFGMLSPGVPNTQLQIDFGWRSEHMMAVVSKQLIKLFYGSLPKFSFWNGCSTGGRQGLAMAQRFPYDYDGILACAPAVHFEKLGLGQTWPQVPMLMENKGTAVAKSKQDLATQAAIAACDALDVRRGDAKLPA